MESLSIEEPLNKIRKVSDSEVKKDKMTLKKFVSNVKSIFTDFSKNKAT
jgi:hypothetical protein